MPVIELNIKLTNVDVSRLISALDQELQALRKFGHPADPGHNENVARLERLREKLRLGAAAALRRLSKCN